MVISGRFISKPSVDSVHTFCKKDERLFPTRGPRGDLKCRISQTSIPPKLPSVSHIAALEILYIVLISCIGDKIDSW